MIQTNLSKQKFRNLALMVPLLVLTLALSGDMVPAQFTLSSPVTIKNFGKVNESYYRGSQPTEDELLQLKRLGIKTIIDLRKDKKSGAADWVTKAGMVYFNIPLEASKAATGEQTLYFMKLVNDPENWPVYVHCKGGRHRTGALTAVYRITHDGWTADQAFLEMKTYDFDHGFFGGPGAQKKYVYSFYRHHVATSK